MNLLNGAIGLGFKNFHSEPLQWNNFSVGFNYLLNLTKKITSSICVLSIWNRYLEISYWHAVMALIQISVEGAVIKLIQMKQ